MSKLTALFIDAAAENVEALPKRLADLGVRYDEVAGGGVRRPPARVLLAVLRRAALRDRPDPGHPRGVPAHLRDEPPTALALRAPRQGDRDARLGRRELYPDFNVFEVAKPYARELMMQRFSPGRLARDAQNETRDLVRVLRAAPQQLHDLLESLRRRPDRGAPGPGRARPRLTQSRRRAQQARDRARRRGGADRLELPGRGGDWARACRRWQASASRCRSGWASG